MKSIFDREGACKIDDCDGTHCSLCSYHMPFNQGGVLRVCETCEQTAKEYWQEMSEEDRNRYERVTKPR